MFVGTPSSFELKEGGGRPFPGQAEFLGGPVTNAVAELLEVDASTCRRLGMRDVENHMPEDLARVATESGVIGPMHNPSEWSHLECERRPGQATGWAEFSAALVISGPKEVESWPLVNCSVPEGSFWATKGWAEAERVWLCSGPHDFLVMCDLLPREAVVAVAKGSDYEEVNASVHAICQRLAEAAEHPLVKIVGAVSEIKETVLATPAGRVAMAWGNSRGDLQHVEFAAFRPSVSAGFGVAGLNKRLGSSTVQRHLRDIINTPKRVSMLDMSPLAVETRHRAKQVYKQLQATSLAEYGFGGDSAS